AGQDDEGGGDRQQQADAEVAPQAERVAQPQRLPGGLDQGEGGVLGARGGWRRCDRRAHELSLRRHYPVRFQRSAADSAALSARSSPSSRCTTVATVTSRS